ncbi:response regulator [Leptolyngbya sp. AN03gr2]|uniref:response regulator n=1 Tax=Leptolyngbya sp. AN03gr2 TaxID=3423364 RepID=UPI003D31A7D5
MLQNRRVLVVDDHEDSRSLFEHVLRCEQAYVMLASSVSQALQIVGCYKPHLILTDIALPGEDGFSLLRQIRQMSLGQIKRVPVVAVTGFVSCDLLSEVQQAGFQECLLKPVDLDRLLQTVKTLTSPKLVEFDWDTRLNQSIFF